MRPAPFSYHAADSLEHVYALLERHGEDARLLAGGQSLVPMMNLRIAQPGHVIDINPIEELGFIREDTGRIEVGALTRHCELEKSAVLGRTCPILPFAAGAIGHYAIRCRGTIGGSLAHADPAAELPLVAVLLDAGIIAASSSGTRAVPAGEFFVSTFATALDPGEVVERIVFPVLAHGEGWGFRSIGRRIGDFAIVSAATTVLLDQTGRVERLRIALGGVGATPVALPDVAERVLGHEPEPDLIAVVASAAAEHVQPDADMHASREYRRELVEVLLRKALEDAVSGAVRERKDG